MSRRFLCTDFAGKREVVLSADASRHIEVLRLEIGARIVLFDGKGGEAIAEITAMRSDSVECVIREERVVAGSAGPVHLIQSLPKGRKIESIVRMATEIGVRSIHIARTERVVGDVSLGKLDRLQKIAEEAARQSERANVPLIHETAPLASIVERIPTPACRLVFDREGGTSISMVLGGAPTEVWFATGPEGGFAQSDRDVFQRSGFVSVTLGPTVLRAETAPIAALAVIQERLRQIGH